MIKASFIKNYLQDMILLIVSCILFSPTLRWIGNVFFGLYDYFNLFLLVLIAALIFNRLQNSKWKQFKLQFQFRVLPFFILILGLVLWSYSNFILDINIASSSAMFLYLFGLLGFYIPPKLWIKSIIPFGLILMTLPFGSIMDVYIGFPLRLFATDVIASIFNALSLNNVTSSTIITVENSATQIDFSCSGIKGIWSSLIFFFALTWIDNLKISLNWFIALGILLGSIIIANTFRIFSIVYISSVLERSDIADLIHAPLGIIGFAFSCALIIQIVKSSFYKESLFNKRLLAFPELSTQFSSTLKVPPVWVKSMVILLLSSFLFFNKRPPVTVSDTIDISLPTTWQTKDLELSSKEKDLFEAQGNTSLKFTFQKETLTGSILIVKSNGWRGHHNPEFCIRAGGHVIKKLQTIRLKEDQPIKWMKVDTNASACYWFQSPSITTDEFGTRVWSDIKNEESNWLLISVVFDDPIEIENPKVISLLNELNSTINNSFNPQLKSKS